VSAVATVGYCAFLVGPPLIGVVGEHIGILNALIIVFVLIVLATFAAPAARPPRGIRPATAAADAGAGAATDAPAAGAASGPSASAPMS
jgi:hypothetical protein